MFSASAHQRKTISRSNLNKSKLSRVAKNAPSAEKRQWRQISNFFGIFWFKSIKGDSMLMICRLHKANPCEDVSIPQFDI